jgi:predicted MFS family arabinose efflux permease
MNVVYAPSAYPLRALSDRLDRKLMLSAGFATAILADIVLAAAPNLWIVMTDVVLWGQPRHDARAALRSRRRRGTKSH